MEPLTLIKRNEKYLRNFSRALLGEHIFQNRDQLLSLLAEEMEEPHYMVTGVANVGSVGYIVDKDELVLQAQRYCFSQGLEGQDFEDELENIMFNSIKL